ncbi:MAG: GNAT family N-acetyltransferase [Pyrinomonadaceae bacterium]
MVEIRQVATDAEIAAAQTLFREYETWFGMDLCFQGFEGELAGLPGNYVPPEGRLLLARIGEDIAGCIALRKLNDGICEMKRLYVRDGFRGHKVGIQLIDRVIADAREIGYSKMRLDTHPPKMGKAVSLYESLGFVAIPAYYDNPHDNVLFMELAL